MGMMCLFSPQLLSQQRSVFKADHDKLVTIANAVHGMLCLFSPQLLSRQRSLPRADHDKPVTVANALHGCDVSVLTSIAKSTEVLAHS